MAKKPPVPKAAPVTYTIDTKLHFHVEMNMQGAEQSDNVTLGEELAISAEELAKLTDEEVEKLIEGAFQEWLWNEVSAGWSRVE